jgi:hypothetical protein
MSLDPQSLYVQLGRLIEMTPADLEKSDPMPLTSMQWLGKALALVEEANYTAEILSLRRAADVLRLGGGRETVEVIMVALHTALAKAELRAPAAAQGAFIPAGNSFDAMAAVGKVMQTASQDVFVVDPYMDEKVLTDFAILTGEGVALRLLADQKGHRPTLAPAAARWAAQYRTTRALAVRLAPAGSLHDRLIVVDGTTAWVLTQSLNAFAARSPASIVRVDPETAALKILAYESMWTAAPPI